MFIYKFINNFYYLFDFFFIYKFSNFQYLAFAFKNYLNNKENSDICFVVEDRNLYAHRAILWSRKPNFLEKEFDDSLEYQTIPIANVSYNNFYKIIEFIVSNLYF